MKQFSMFASVIQLCTDADDVTASAIFHPNFSPHSTSCSAAKEPAITYWCKQSNMAADALMR